MIDGCTEGNGRTARVAREWPTLLAQLQLEALAQFDRQFHRLTSVQRDIERLRALQLEGYDARTPEAWQVLKLLEASVKALVDEATRAPATFVEMQSCVTVLMLQPAGAGDRTGAQLAAGARSTST
jgi:hypothetical protein